MEDYESNILNDSKNEWSIRLMNILSGHIIDGFRSIFNEAMEICEKNDEAEKYLMTFQNFLSMIPKWNQNMVDTEVDRIKTSSQCNYLEDLITCVHIIQLKILSCVRTSNKNQKIDIDIPCFKTFLHLVYINIARKLYSNIYLFQIDVTPLEQQKNNREFELIVQICIMNTIRDNIPIEILLKQYIDETQEIDVETTEKIVHKPEPETKTNEDPNTTSNISQNENSNDNGDDNNNGITELKHDATLEKKDKPSNSISNNSISNNSISNDIENKETSTGESVTFETPLNTSSSNSTTFEEKDSSLLEDGGVDNSHDMITIGEDVPLKLETDFDDSTEPVLQEATLKIENEPIDLGIEELTL